MVIVSRVAALVASTVALTVGIASAQTPGQMEYERQQREYWRQQEQQRQEQQRQQQLMQDNARRQQEESSRINAPTGQGQTSGGQRGPAGAGGGGDPAAAALSAARAKWEKQPPLPADRNPLLGRWTRPASSRPNSSDPFGALVALAKGGLCEALFGGGVFEFRPDRLVGMDDRTPEQELDRVEYRGSAKHVVVIPKTTLKLMEFDFDGPDRIHWTGQNCTLVRVAAAPKAAAGTPSGTSANVATASTSAAANKAAGSGGVLSLSVGASAPDSKVAGRKLWVLKEDAQVALIKGGLKSTPDGSVLQNWMRACQSRAPACATGARALQAYTIGIATTDTSGHAQTPPLPAGRYWVLSDTKVGSRHMMWNQPVDLKEGGKSLTLDQANAMPVN